MNTEINTDYKDELKSEVSISKKSKNI